MGEARGESRRAAVIGCGALGALTAEGIAKDLAASWRLSGVLANTREHAEKLAGRLGCRALASLDELLEDRPDMVVEAAGVGAARAHAERVLRAGSSLVLLSAGCLADTEFAARLARAAEEGGSVLHVPSGAVGGFDLLRTLSFRDRQLARLGRADGDRLAVRVDNVKPPQGLAGAPWLEHRPLSPVTR
ncbi:MAG: Gfo/Idh/MocA family oxidoreductase, partial [Desulfovibrionaceae bacterium]|nr:Gfo/Idh/MocA family oxidoreductase [Desulfovibrionaceae bacterium]